MTNLSDSDVNLRGPAVDAPRSRPIIDRDVNLRPGPMGEVPVSPNMNPTTCIIAAVVAVLIVGAIIYGFSGSMNHPATNRTTVPTTTDPATPATAPPKAQ
jgi:hypothetical protein